MESSCAIYLANSNVVRAGCFICEAFEAVGSACVLVAKKTGQFIKENWKLLLVYLVAWGLIIGCSGMMYGFKTVALPLTIGISCGLIFGIISGIVVVKAVDKDGKYSIWNLLNRTIEKLPPNGTKQIVTAVLTTAILAATVIFPYVIGAAIGIVIGNQLGSKGSAGKPMGNSPERLSNQVQDLQDELSRLREANNLMQSRLNNLALLVNNGVAKHGKR